MDSPLEEKRWEALGRYIDRLRSKHVLVSYGGVKDYEYIIISFKGSSLEVKERFDQEWRPWGPVRHIEHLGPTVLEREVLKCVVGPLMKKIDAEIERLWKDKP